MARWQPDSRGRLVRAALDLYSERGFEQATVAEIAARAGLTERTYFRYFADKREVLFWGAQALEDHLVGAVVGAPTSAGPFDAVAAAFVGAAASFEERKEGVRRRQAVVAANRELHERELVKLDALAAALTGALERRGAGPTAARLAAGAGVAVFHVGFNRWTEGPDGRRLAEVLQESFDDLQEVTARPAQARRV